MRPVKLPQLTLGRVVLLAILLGAGVGAGYLLFGALWSTTAAVHLPYDEAESKLFKALNLDKSQLTASKVAQSDVSGELAKPLTMGIHTHRLLDYTPAQRVHFAGDHSYNFFGSGHEWVEFDLTSKDQNTCTITVDYFENSWLLDVIPVSWESGRKQERHIITTIFDRNIAP